MENLKYIDDFITIVMLWFIATSCLVGAYDKCYNGNTFQRIGFFLIAVWAVWEAFIIMETKSVELEVFIGALGFSIFSLGTIAKTYFWNKRNARKTS